MVNADSRGCGHSDGTGKLLSRQEAEDTYDLVQWIADQPWCDGHVVMFGVSYLAISQYAVAALRPPALRAICPWEGFTDAYRDLALSRRRSGDRLHPVVVDATSIATRRQAYALGPMQDDIRLRDDFWRSLVPDLSAINGADAGLRQLLGQQPAHPRLDSRIHSGRVHATPASTPIAGANGRPSTPKPRWPSSWSSSATCWTARRASRTVRLDVREDRDTVAAVREENEWPLARTRWRPLYLAGPACWQPSGRTGGQRHIRNPSLGQRLSAGPFPRTSS